MDAQHLVDAGTGEFVAEPEWLALESVCLEADQSGYDDLDALLLSNSFRYGELIEQAIHHSLLPLVVDRLERISSEAQVPDPLIWTLHSFLDLNRSRNRLYTLEALQILSKLRECGIPVVCTKGLVFQFTLYDDPGTRVLSDIDMMILPRDRKRVVEVMHGLGYVMGKYDWLSGRTVKHSRQDQIRYQLNPDHLPHFVRHTNQVEAPYVSVDFANSFTWTNSQWQIPIQEALVEPVRIMLPREVNEIAGELLSLPTQHSFVFAVLHLFREAWLQRTAKAKTRLSQFCDISRFWHRKQDVLRNQIPEIIRRYGIEEPMAWVCGHTDSVFGTSMTIDLGLADRVSETWLQSARGIDGGNLRWVGTMRERLCQKGDLEFYSA